MKILHVCLASAFTEGMSYQDNLLSEQNAKDGCNVTIISDCHKFDDGKIVDTCPESKIIAGGIHLIRLKYKRIINNFISGKIRIVPRLYHIIKEISPDVILFHGVAGWELTTVAKYKKEHPNTRLYVDSHEDFHNSGTNILSRIVQYKLFNNSIVKRTLPYIDKILYVTIECKEFLEKMYKITDNKMEYYPLGGIVYDDFIKNEKRNNIRVSLNLKDDQILLIHSGKLDKIKRTKDLLSAFIQVKDERLVLAVIGTIDDSIKSEIHHLMSMDNRIIYLGWKSSSELLDYLCGCDLYIQPGSQSATLQNALCCGCAVAVYPHGSHNYLLEDNAFYVETIDDMIYLFKKLLEDNTLLENKKRLCYKIAVEKLDYRVLAKRLYE